MFWHNNKVNIDCNYNEITIQCQLHDHINGTLDANGQSLAFYFGILLTFYFVIFIHKSHYQNALNKLVDMSSNNIHTNL